MIKSTWVVAKWEFSRFCKVRDQIIGMLSLLIGGCIGIGAVKLSESTSRVTLVVTGTDAVLTLPKDANIELKPSSEGIEPLRKQLGEKTIDGILSFGSAGEPSDQGKWKLLVRNEPTWLPAVKTAINQWQSQTKLQGSGLSQEKLAEILLPASLDVELFVDSKINKWDRLAAMLILMMTILASWLGLAFMLTGITGEKQQRVTEQIVSAISPQAWIDGKLIGLTMASLVSTGNLVLCGVLAWLVSKWIGYTVALPASLSRVDLIPCVVLYALGGVFFWNCFYASVAAIINDPNSSARSSLMFLPVLPLATAAFAMSQPDGIWMKTLSLLPISSPTAMPIRLMLGEVTWLELGMSVLLLALGIVLLRTIAGRIFTAGIMLTGKEPSWLEVARWVIEGPKTT